MENKITLEDIAHRLDALETIVASLSAEKNKGTHSDEPRGKFAHIGGIERQPAHEFESSHVDLSEAYGETGKRVG
jgi:hypothetical protein